MKPIVLINGKRTRRISVFERTHQFGDGLFETLVIRDGKLLFWHAHFVRLERGRERLGIAKVSEKVWLSDIAKACQLSGFDQAVVKLTLSRGQSVRGYGFDQAVKPTRMVVISPLPETPEFYRLSRCTHGYGNNTLLAGIKHNNRLEQVMARADLQADECIMCNANSQVISVTQGNIFYLKGQVLVTPELRDCGIEGTVREQVIQLAEELGLSVQIRAVDWKQLIDADEVFITNSVIGIKPVVSIDQTNYPVARIHEIANAFETLSARRTTTLKPTNNRLKKWLLALGVLATLSVYHVNQVHVNHTTIFEVKPGVSSASVAQELSALGYISSSTYAKHLSRLLGVDSLKRGFYQIEPEMSVYQLFERLSTNQVAQRDITLIEGQTVAQYFEQLSQHPALSSQYGLGETLKRAGVSAPYDGQLWPETYRIDYGDSLVSLFARAHQTLQKNLDQAWQARAENHPLDNASQALVLASLIERETAHNSEKAKIAGVFIARLEKGMRLQTDPSVIYALGDRYQGRLSKADLKVDSPYNTYRHKGLPPGAIGAVGQASLEAAMHPELGDDLYFVSKKDGTHAFAKTYQQHRHNIKKYLK